MLEETSLKRGLFLLETLPAGVVQLSADREVVAMNDHARSLLPVGLKKPFGKVVSAFHKARSRSKVASLFDEMAGCPLEKQTSLTMMIDVPDRVLLIKLSPLANESSQTTGYVLVLFDVTDLVAEQTHATGSTPGLGTLQLTQIPTVVDRGIRFLPATSVTCLESRAHTTRVYTREGSRVCNLSIGELQYKLDATQFIRVHRRFIVNLEQVSGLCRIGSRTQVLLNGDSAPEVPVSRECLATLKRALRVAKRP